MKADWKPISHIPPRDEPLLLGYFDSSPITFKWDWIVMGEIDSGSDKFLNYLTGQTSDPGEYDQVVTHWAYPPGPPIKTPINESPIPYSFTSKSRVTVPFKEISSYSMDRFGYVTIKFRFGDDITFDTTNGDLDFRKEYEKYLEYVASI